MQNKTIILGIETSCDETAVALIRENNNGNPQILSNVISSQVDIHKEFGGVVPELAARAHAEKIDLIAKKAIYESGVEIDEISASLFDSWFKFWKSNGIIIKLAIDWSKSFRRPCIKS